MEDQRDKPFDFLNQIDPCHFLNFIYKEHPQTIALILSFIEPSKAAIILQNLTFDVQGDVSRRIITMGSVDAETVRDVEQALKEELTSLSGEYFSTGGIECAKNIINFVDGATEKNIIETLEDDDPELAEEVKKQLFSFEDILILDDRSLQKVMREVDSQELVKALKSTTTEVQNKFFNNMSKRAASMLMEDMKYMGPVRLLDVGEAQAKIIKIIRHLEDSGEIIINRKKDVIIGGTNTSNTETTNG